jgi:hypothetical protein
MARAAQVFTRRTLVRGQPTDIRCLTLSGQVFEISAGPIRTARLEQEWYEDLVDPATVVAELEALGVADILTFVQRFPDLAPQHDYHHEPEHWAVLSTTSVDDWWSKRISSRTRSLIRKSRKEGLDVRLADWDETFVAGMTAIFNETPVRQGRPFWHYGKSIDEVRDQFSRFLHRETLIGAYVGDEMVGFMMLGHAGKFSVTGQILSLTSHRHRSPNNALIAKAVEICCAKASPALVYLNWGSGSFSEFKRRCGFERVEVPRYFVPLNARGRYALRLGIHDGYRRLMPESLIDRAKAVRSWWYERRAGSAAHST